MSDLAELQARFRSFLLDGDRDIEAHTVGTDALPAGERLAVYGNAYRLRLLEILEGDFPGLKALLGDEAFDTLGRAYIDAHPSTHPSVRWFGRHLAGFLRATPSCGGQPWLAEMAAFEWMQGEVMDAADGDAVTVEALAAVDPAAWPGMTIRFQPALRRLDLEWNVPAVWQAVREDRERPGLLRAPPVPWLLWRLDLQAHWRSLDEDEAWAIDAARDGAAFGALCEGLLARTHDDQVPVRAAGFLKRWVSDELVARIDA